MWHPELLPERVVRAWYQESIPAGEVSEWPSGGVKPTVAAQPEPGLRPTKLPDNRGVLFRRSERQALVWSVEQDAPYLYRWWLVIARCAGQDVPPGEEVPVVTVNGADGGPGYRQPRVAFRPGESRIVAQFNDGQFKTEGGRCSPSGEEWTVIVGYRRGYLLQVVVNGEKSAGQELRGIAPNLAKSQSFMGDVNAVMPADVAIDCVIFGQGEPDDAFIERLTGWAMWRIGRQSELALNHRYRTAAPAAADDVEPTRFAFDARAWTAWTLAAQAGRYSHRGKAAPSTAGYSTVFFDDFVVHSVVDDLSGAPGSVWYAPTHLGNIGANARAQRVAARPSSYVHDARNHTLALRLLNENGWKTGALSSVNNNGQGRFWGKGIFEIRARFPAIPTPRPGFFPAFWAYGREHLFWRTRNRLETDFWEYGGFEGAYININQHVHRPTLMALNEPGIIAKDVRYKIAGYRADGSNGFPRTVDIYDGEFHTWYTHVDDDVTYFVVDGLEVARVPTTAELVAPKYIMVDFALDATKGGAVADPAQTYDMVIDYIRVRQKESDLEKIPLGFSALPSLAGVATPGSRLTVNPNTSAGHIEYLWYRDGTPVADANGASYLLRAGDKGGKIRCQIRALSLIGQPEAWTQESETVA